MIKKAEDLTIGDRIVYASREQLGEVKNVSRGEEIVGATVQYYNTISNEPGDLRYFTWDVGTEVFVAVPAQPADWSQVSREGDDLADRSMTEPPLTAAPTSRVDDFIREHTGKVEEIRSMPGHIPNTFPE